MKTCTCGICGYEWQKGTDGGHSCSEHLSKRVAELEMTVHSQRHEIERLGCKLAMKNN